MKDYLTPEGFRALRAKRLELLETCTPEQRDKLISMWHSRFSWDKGYARCKESSKVVDTVQMAILAEKFAAYGIHTEKERNLALYKEIQEQIRECKNLLRKTSKAPRD